MINWSTLTFAQQIDALARPAMADSAKLKATVADILAQVDARGDEAVLEFTRRFDSPALTSLKLSIEKRDELAARVTPEVQDAIQTAFANVKQFHEAQYPQDIRLTTTPGVVCDNVLRRWKRWAYTSREGVHHCPLP